MEAPPGCEPVWRPCGSTPPARNARKDPNCALTRRSIRAFRVVDLEPALGGPVRERAGLRPTRPAPRRPVLLTLAHRACLFRFAVLAVIGMNPPMTDGRTVRGAPRRRPRAPACGARARARRGRSAPRRALGIRPLCRCSMVVPWEEHLLTASSVATIASFHGPRARGDKNVSGAAAWVAGPDPVGPEDGVRRLRRGIRGPKVAVACQAHPELIGLPCCFGARVPEVHQRATALAAHLKVDLSHSRWPILRGSLPLPPSFVFAPRTLPRRSPGMQSRP